MVTGLSDLGLTFLIFLAGYELDLEDPGPPLRLATAGWGISLAIGMAAAFALVGRPGPGHGGGRPGPDHHRLGTLVPILRDAHVWDTKFGRRLGHRHGGRVRAHRGRRPRSPKLPMALFSATGLPLIVVITSIALAEGRMLQVNAASLVAAGMLSVMLFPAVGWCG